MQKWFGMLLIVVTNLTLTLPLAARDWHVAADGVDDRDGSLDNPLATFAHAVSRASNGDRVLLQRNGRFVARAVDVSQGISVLAYGSGDDPVLTASVPVAMTSTWNNNSAVRTTNVTERVLACYVDGRFVPLARYPNQGFLSIDNDNDPNRIVDSELASRPGVSSGRWTGAQVRWRRWSWWWETRPISAHSAIDTLELGDEGRFQDNFSDIGSGYFIDNDLDELDAPGEWFWGNGTLYIYPPSWSNPADMRVDIVIADTYGVRSGGANFEHVQFKQFVGTALEINRPTTVENCSFEELETNAIAMTWDAQPSTIRLSTFRDVRNVAITVWGNPAAPEGPLIERNLLQHIGSQRGYGGSGAWHAAGMIIGRANTATVRLNRIIDTGYAGIILGSDGQIVERNVIVRSMGTLNDGAAIYTNCNASVIRENIILDTVGDLETSHPWYPMGHGIWPEFLSDFRDTEIVNNSVYGSNGHGIMLPNNFSCDVSGNNVVDSRRAGLGLSGDANDNQDHTITQNVLAAVVPSRRVLRPEKLSQWWLPPYAEPLPVALDYELSIDYGSMSATTFVASATGAELIRGGETVYSDLNAWTSAAPWANASNSTAFRKNASMLFNDTESETDMQVPTGSWSLVDGSTAGSRISVPAFRSVILLSDDPVTVQPPYFAASGIDWRAEEPCDAVLSGSPELSVSRAGATIANNSVDNVHTIVVNTGVELDYQISNVGGIELTLVTPVVLADVSNCQLSVQNQPAAHLLSGANTHLQVEVTAAQAGAWSFSVSFANNDADENPMHWTVSGQAQEGHFDAGHGDLNARQDGSLDSGHGDSNAQDSAILDTQHVDNHAADGSNVDIFNADVAAKDAGATTDAGDANGDQIGVGCSCATATVRPAWLAFVVLIVCTRRYRH